MAKKSRKSWKIRILSNYSVECFIKFKESLEMDLTLVETDKTNVRNKVKRFCELGKAVLATEAEAISHIRSKIDQSFSDACEHLLNCQGRIIVIGMGKSGHVGNKIAATFASTGSPAFFVHPGEASHGDLGMITRKDVVLAISNSGETSEILTILPIIKRLSVPMICMTGNPTSTLAKMATAHIDVSVTQEACPLGLAPTASTTAALAMGDALAIALLEVRGFTAEDFALSHPGGALGRRLLLHIEDVMRTGDAIPCVGTTTLLSEALVEMTRKGLGMTAVLDDEGHLAGIFTDGDLRRTIEKEISFSQTPIADVMTSNCKTIKPNTLAAEALEMMEKFKINGFIVVDNYDHPIGAFNMQDLLRFGAI